MTLEKPLDSKSERLEDVTRPTIGDVARTLPEAVLAVVPGSGAVSPFLALVCAPPAARRRDAFIQDVSDRLQVLEDAGLIKLDDLDGNDAFITAVLRVIPSAMSTASTAKLDALRNAALNTALDRHPREDLFEMFLRYVDDLTPLHIKLLVLFDDPQQLALTAGMDFGMAVGAARWEVVHAVYPELDDQQAVCVQAWSELHDRGLVAPDSLGGLVTPSGLAQNLTTELGRQFVQFITDPEVDAG